MNKVYLSIIALLCMLVLFFIFEPNSEEVNIDSTNELSSPSDQPKDENRNSEDELGSEKSTEELFREYFEDVTPIDDFFKDRTGVQFM
ncbi:hypothetical protein [Thalassobacillus sp. CUG 92003]|uniref:hypothetical protein n=1 Tax=Thalassobacillus sp. CUG 92003 TaxID=2736641 RepID=UPI0015E7BF30|nr:hypothetical protein [Thalassobacillus sp. CUG 92003]